MIPRRSFLKLTGAGLAAFFASANGKFIQRALAQIPGGTLSPLDVPKYVTPLLIPPVMPKAGIYWPLIPRCTGRTRPAE